MGGPTLVKAAAAWKAASFGDKVAAVSLGLTATTTVASLPAYQISVSKVNITKTVATKLYVGDSFGISVETIVSYGDLWWGGEVLVELFEVGLATAIATDARTDRSGIERIVASFSLKAVKDGFAEFYAVVTVTGENDTIGPFDTSASLPQNSIRIGVNVLPPVELEVSPLQIAVSHGQKAEANIYGTNYSTEKIIQVAWLFDDQRDEGSLTAKVIRERLERKLKPHGGAMHDGTVRYWFRDNKLVHAFMSIHFGGHAVPYKQGPANLKDVIVDCTGKLPPPPTDPVPPPGGNDPSPPRDDDTNNRKRKKYRVKTKCRGPDGEGVECSGWIFDDFGNRTQVRTDKSGNLAARVSVQDALLTVMLSPISGDYAPVQFNAPVDMLTGEYDVGIPLQRGPDITGRILIANSQTPVEGAVVSLRTSSDKALRNCVSDENGEFLLGTDHRDLHGEPTLHVKLPFAVHRKWVEDELTLPLNRTYLEAGFEILVHPQLKRSSKSVTISGTAYGIDGITREVSLFSGLSISLVDEKGTVAAQAETGKNGTYRLKAPAGVYTVLRSADSIRGIAAFDKIVVRLTASRTDMDIRVSGRAPNVHRVDNGRAIGNAGFTGEATEIVAVQRGKIIARGMADANGAFALDLPKKALKGGDISLASISDGRIGRLSAPIDGLRR